MKKKTLYESFFENRSVSDRRFIELLLKNERISAAGLMESLEETLQNLEEGKSPEAMRKLRHIIKELGPTEDLPKIRKSIDYLRQLEDDSVFAAMIRLLDEISSPGYKNPDELERLRISIHLLAFCFRKGDPRNGRESQEIVELRRTLRRVLIENNYAHSDYDARRAKIIETLAGIYFGYIETGSIFNYRHSGLVPASEWLSELGFCLKAFYGTAYAVRVAKILEEICEIRLNEATRVTATANRPRLFKTEEQINDLRVIKEELERFVKET